MIMRRSGDPIKAIRQAVDNSLMGRLLGLGDRGEVSYQDAIPQYDPDQSIYERDPAGLPSTFDAAGQMFTGVGDLIELVAAAEAAGRGDYLEASLAPLFMILPGPLGKRLKKTIGELQKVKAVKSPDQALKVARLAGDLDEINREALIFRQKNPQAYDQAMKEVAVGAYSPGTIPLENVNVEDLAADAFITGRQRELGYTGRVPDSFAEELKAASRDPLGGPPITTTDKRGMSAVTGTPSERGVKAALLHQAHGSAGGTGMLSASEMQRMAHDMPLVRTPIAGRPYRVIRDGQEMTVKAGQMEDGDLILSLSQHSGGTHQGGSRLVSTSGSDLESNYMTFGPKPPEKANFGPAPLSMNLFPEDDLMDMADEFGADLPDLGDFGDPNRPSFKIIKTKGMPVTRADVYRPGSGPRSGGMAGEDEFGVSAKQPFRVLQTGLEEEGVPFMLLAPELGKRFKYNRGGKMKVLKR